MSPANSMLRCGTEAGRRGAALLLALPVLLVLALCSVLAHRLALDLLRRGHAALATVRAREASSAGLEVVLAGGALTGSLSGGASWSVTVRTTPAGERILWSLGTAQLPSPASLEVLAVVPAPDSAAPDTAMRGLGRRWIVLRR